MTQRESALRVVSEADSLDHCGMLYADTLQLRAAAESLCELTHRTDKAKALYYLGRNYSEIGEDATAADCYIAADRLRPNDAVIHGRILSNMAYICAQQNKDSLAIIFAEKASTFFISAADSTRYYYNVLDIFLSYTKMGNIQKADSVYKILPYFSFDNPLYSYSNGLRAYYYNNISEYDSALLYLDKVSMPEIIGMDFYNSQCAIALYYTNRLDSAVLHSMQILGNPNSRAAFIMSSYNILREKAYRENEMSLNIYYNEQMERLQTDIDNDNEQRIQAIEKMKTYLSEPNYSKIFLVSSIFVIIILVIISLFVLWYKKSYMFQKEFEQNEFNIIITENRKKIQHNIDEIGKSDDWKATLSWKNINMSIYKINFYFNEMGSRLKETYGINDVEIRYCTMLMLGFNSKYISDNLPYSYNGLKILKRRVSVKLGTNPTKLADFVTDFAMEMGNTH